MAVDPLNLETKQLDIHFYIAKYVTPILENIWVVIGCTLAGVLFAIPLSLLTYPEYTSSATVMVEEPRAKMVSKVTEKISTRPADPAYIKAEVEKIKGAGFFITEVLKVLPDQCLEDLDISLEFPDQVISRSITLLEKSPAAFLVNLVKKIRETEKKEQKKDSEITENRLIILSKRITFQIQARSGIIKISATTLAPETAMILAKSYLDVWSALNLEENKSFIKREIAFTKDQRKIYLAQLRLAETELLNFKNEYEIPPPVTSVTDPEIQSHLDVLQNKVDSAKERYKRQDEIFWELSRKEKTVVNNIRVIKIPQIPCYPSSTLRGKIIFFGFAIGLLIGTVPILLWDYYNGTIRHKRDITDTTDISIIGNISKV